VTNFTRIVPVLSSILESVLKLIVTYACELRLRCSLYQNRSAKILESSIPGVAGFGKFIFPKKWSQDFFSPEAFCQF